MARKTKLVTIETENRDHGKSYFLTEMPASQAERWAARAMLGMGRSGMEVPEDFANAGMAAIAVVGVRALATMSFEDAEPLLDEMMGCVQFVPDPTKPDIMRPLVETDTEEITTRLRLRSEVIELHLGFSIAGALRTLGAAARSQEKPSSSTSMPAEPSAPSSLPDSPA